jgi:predicted AAA+ superfamily ATPase
MIKKIRRKYYLEKLFSYKDKDIIKVVTGLRRSGKSTLLQMFRDDLSKNEISEKQIRNNSQKCI